MRVLVISEHYSPIVGGSTTYVHNLCRSLSEIGCEVYLVTIPSEENPVSTWYRNEDFYIYRLRIPGFLRKERYFPIFLGLKMNAILREVKPDVMHFAHGFFSPAITRLIKKRPVVWTIHNVPPREHVFTRFRRFPRVNQVLGKIYFFIAEMYGKFALRAFYYDVLVCNSVKTAKLAAKAGVPEKRIVTIPMGVDTEIFRLKAPLGIKEKYGLEKFERIVLTVGNIVERKGLYYLIKAMPQVLQGHPNTLLLIVGSIKTRDFYNKLLGLIEEEGLRENIKFLCDVEEVAPFYSVADLYVQASLEEGFCISILEAMACGKPVIGTKTGEIPRFIRESGGGLLIEPASAQEISQTMIRLLDDEEKRREMGRKARRYALKYEWKKIAEATLGLYESLTQPSTLTSNKQEGRD
jgi:glycosyltransferase involved in cell wall biosynthesis